MTTHSPFRGAMFALASFGSYAGSDVMVKFLGKDMNSFQVMFLAAVFTLPFILGQILITNRGGSLKPVLPHWTYVRIVITVINSALVTYTFTHLPIAQCYAIFFTMPLMITLLAWPLLGEPIDPLRGVIILVGFAGVLIAVQPGSTTFHLAHLTAICGATLGALNSLILRRIGGRERSGVILVYPVMAQAAGAALVLPFVWTPLVPHDYVAGTILGFLGALGGLFIIAAYRTAPAIVVAPMQYSQIVWASILGFILWGELPSLITAAGIGLIIAAGLALLFAAGRRPAPVLAA